MIHANIQAFLPKFIPNHNLNNTVMSYGYQSSKTCYSYRIIF